MGQCELTVLLYFTGSVMNAFGFVAMDIPRSDFSDAITGLRCTIGAIYPETTERLMVIGENWLKSIFFFGAIGS